MNMKAHFPAALFLVLLTGCAGTSPTDSATHGNFIEDAPVAYNRKIAFDAVKQLIAVYPPARTRFDLQHPTPDTFGTSLVGSLRAKGYAVLEYQQTTGKAAKAKGAGTETPEPRSVNALATAPLPLGYVLDRANDATLYRVTLLVGRQSLTRAYLVQNGSVFPAGSWVRKE
jgi:hypothetical protein